MMVDRPAIPPISEYADKPDERSSWWPIDLRPVLVGSWQRPEPTVGLRDDGKGLFYPTRNHSIISETEGGKTWLALCASIDEMHAGNHVLYVDFEDDEGSITDRLLALGVGRETITAQFHYIRPEEPITTGKSLNDLREIVTNYRPTLDVLDGITEAMVMHGLNPMDNVDAATFGRMLPRPLARLGAAVANLDHVTKDREGRGRYAIGAVHKLNALNGAAYVLENQQPFGVGLIGRSTLKIAKDRPGQLRRNALSSSGGLHWYGTLLLDSSDHKPAEISVEPPHERDDNVRPTRIMKSISDLLDQKGPQAQREICNLVTGKTDTIRKALSVLIADGYVDRKTPHALLKPYDPEDESS